jgi:hypothetical protein
MAFFGAALAAAGMEFSSFLLSVGANLSTVMPGLVPGIHALAIKQGRMAGTSPAMTCL